MAVWTEFDKAINLPALAARYRDRGLLFNNGHFYQPTAPFTHHTRLGFASKTLAEMEQGIAILSRSIDV